MKRLFIFAICLFIFATAHAQLARFISQPVAGFYDTIINQPGATLQQIIDTLYAHTSPTDTAEGGGLDQLKDFQAFWQGRVVANDSSGRNMFQQYEYALRLALLAGQATPCPGNGSWAPIGPDGLPEQADGYVNAVWADTASDSNYILVGTIYSGLWKTTNGGAQWGCITDNAPLAGGIMGVNHITVNPLNINTIYLGTVGAGILKSFDRGNTWQQEFINSTGIYSDSIATVQAVFMTPDSLRLYALMGTSIYTRSNGNPIGTWQNITPPSTSINWTDLQFVPGNQDNFFVSGTSIWESTVSVPASGDWNNITSGLTATLDGQSISATGWKIIKLSMPESDTLFFFALANNQHANLYKYSVSASQTYLVYSDLPNYYGSTEYSQNKGQLAVSAAATGISRNIYYGWDVPFQSYDGGQSFHPIGTYSAYPTHGDVRGLYLQQATNSYHGENDRLFIATDGGVSKKIPGTDPAVAGDHTTVDISGTGLDCGTFNGFSTSEAGGIGIGCMMHDGISSYEPTQSPVWENLFMADAWTTACDRSNPNNGYAYQGDGYIQLAETAPAGSRKIGEVSNADIIPEPDDANFPAVGPPVEIDNQGNVYVVQNQFWEKPVGSVFSVPATTPPGYGFPAFDTLLGAFMAFDPSASSYTGYVVYNGVNQYAQQAIYYRNPLISSGVASATNNVPGVPTYQITGITTDARNTQRVWVCQGGVNYSNYTYTEHRVKFSPDHGTTWVDISNGLPQRIPVSQIVYDESTNTLYCSTDAGMYTCDFSTYNSASTVSGINTSVSWTCFNKGLITGHNFPNVAVNKLLINHCQNKLYASTYGRSIWATDLPNIYAPPSFDTIATNTIWSTNQYLETSVEVLPGVTLTIKKDTVHMPKNGIIRVEPGAKLVVDSAAVITNDCQSCMWGGIEALGNSSQPQYVYNQGWVLIKNGSVLQHARTAVANWDVADSDVTTTGGVIQATNSSFIDNHEGASFNQYHNYHGSALFPNLSVFLNCKFLTDNSYKGDSVAYPFSSDAWLMNVEGVAFKGDSFLNHNSIAANEGTGIYSYNSGFTVGTYCSAISYVSSCGSPKVSMFRGFLNAIHSTGDMSVNPTISVDHVDFDSVAVGIYESNISGLSATQNSFDIGHGTAVYDVDDGDCYQNIGIYSQNCPQFRIEQNLFGADPIAGEPTNFGVVVVNSGPNDKVVYHNLFVQLTNACFAYGQNSNAAPPGGDLPPLPTGLSFKCNGYTLNGSDIVVGSDGNPYHGIDAYQGSYDTAAGNNFTDHLGSITNNGSYFTYFYYTSDETPAVGGSNYATVSALALNDNTCNSTIASTPTVSPVTYDNSTFNTFRRKLNDATTAYNDSLAIYNGLLDGGSTSSFITDIQSAPDSSSQIALLESAVHFVSYNALMALKAAALMSRSTYIQLISKSTDVLRDSISLYNLVASDKYLFAGGAGTSDELTFLKESADHISPTRHTLLTASISDANQEMSKYTGLLLMGMKTNNDTDFLVSDTGKSNICTDTTSMYYGLDSNSYYCNIDSTATLLQNTDELWAQYDLGGYYIFTGQPIVLDTLMADIPTLFTLSSADSIEYNDYDSVINILARLSSCGKTVNQLSTCQQTILTDIGAQVSANKAAVTAYNILQATNMPYTFPCALIFIEEGGRHYNGSSNQDTGGSNQDFSPLSPISNLRVNAQVSAYPNPAKDKVIFSYSVPGAVGSIVLTITNELGETVSSFTLSGNVGKVSWDTQNMASGIYVYQMSDESGRIAIGKIVIER